jgi:Na+-driven multidrug efflux pump
MSWRRLTLEQQKAATILGYSESMWSEEGPKIDLQQEKFFDEQQEKMSEVQQEKMRGWKVFCKVIACDTESRRIQKIAIPGSLNAATAKIVDAIVVALLSNNLGPHVFVAYAMTYLFAGIAGTLTSGISGATFILGTQAIGAENYFLAGQYTQLAASLSFLYLVPMYIVLIYYVEDALLGLRFEEEVARRYPVTHKGAIVESQLTVTLLLFSLFNRLGLRIYALCGLLVYHLRSFWPSWFADVGV